MSTRMIGLAGAVGATVLALPAFAAPLVTERVSVATDGRQSNQLSFLSALSADGRFVAFWTQADTLVPGDPGLNADVFVRDWKRDRTELVSVGMGGVQSNGYSEDAAISANGRFVAFESDASNLVPDDTNTNDVFVRDRQRGVTERVSVGAGGVQLNGLSVDPAISGDGRFVAFVSNAANAPGGDGSSVSRIYLRDRAEGTTELVSVGPGGVLPDRFQTRRPALSDGGRYIVFLSDATNLVPGDTNGTQDVFVRDRVARTTTRANVGPGGVQAVGDTCGLISPNISANGRYVAFTSGASNLVAGDTNGRCDVFVRDQVERTTTRISVATNGTQGNGDSFTGQIYGNGRYVAFSSRAGNLVPGDTNRKFDAFVRDRRTGTTTRVSLGASGRQANGGSSEVRIAADGRIVAFGSRATNLVPGDTNGVSDLFVRYPRH